MNPLKDPALIVVDMQNDFVRQGAPFEVPEARETIPTIARLIARFRAQGRPVIFTRYLAHPLYLPLKHKLTWIAALEPPINACVPGFMRAYGDVEGMRDVAAVVDELPPSAADPIVDKIYFSAFHGTDLEQRLASLAVGSVVVTGTVVEMCVEDTARHAVHFGLPTVMVSDAVSSNDPGAKRAALDGFARNYGWVMPAEAITLT
ncbi:cysteine hydrolase family protein [Rhodoligotrophos defluvii]|uniref:cysteine hydrolase family protein n=1 Tax=Rhodoligotrophos defluvii TaxID=2561934 RepID=UPI0010CA1729|nr:cysteine hydrolase [Rhodoligotrophos defluvii]